MEVLCPSCREPLNARDVNVAAGVGVCHKCNKAIQFGHEPLSYKPIVGDVPKLNIRRNGIDIVIERVWRSPAGYALIPFALIWNAFLIFWYTALLKTENPPLLGLIFPIGHVAVGLGLTYGILLNFLNRTQISISRGRLELKHLPH